MTSQRTSQRVTPKLETLLIEMLGRDMPGVTVAASRETDYIDELPMILVDPLNGAMVPGGNSAMVGKKLAWDWSVSFTILDDTYEGADDTADWLYENLHKYHDSLSGIQGLGRIVGTEDISAPRRTSTVSLGETGSITQFDGTFRIVVAMFNG